MARSVAISTWRLAIAEYMQLSAPNTAPTRHEDGHGIAEHADQVREHVGLLGVVLGLAQHADREARIPRDRGLERGEAGGGAVGERGGQRLIAGAPERRHRHLGVRPDLRLVHVAAALEGAHHRPVAVAESRCASPRRGRRTAARPSGRRSPRGRRASNRRPSTIRTSWRMAKAAGRTPRKGTLFGSALALARQVDHHHQLGGGQRAALGVSRHPGQAASERGLVARHAARQLGVRSRAQHDRPGSGGPRWSACGESPPPSRAPTRARPRRRRCRSPPPARCRGAAAGSAD